MNKKSLFLFLGLCLIFSFGMMSCSESENAVEKESYLNVFLDAQPNTLDPSTGADSYGNSVLLNVIEPLIRVAENESGVAYLIAAGAESWDISDDELTYTFHLRDNKWNDGKPVTSKDYAFAIRRNAKPETACMSANFLFHLKNGKDVVEGKKPVEELGVATPDDKTLVLTLGNPVPYFLSICCQRTYYPEREDLFEKYGEKYSTSPETTPQCGPFILLDWVINSQMNFVKNENFWNAGNVSLDTITCKIISDTNTVYNSLLSGGLDYAGVNDPKWRKKIEDNSEFKHSTIYGAGTEFILFNASKGQLTSNKKIRQAMSVSVDRENFIETCKDGVGVPAFSFIPISVNCQEKQFTKKGAGPVKDLIDEIDNPKELFIEGLKELGIDKAPEDITIEYMISGTDQKSRIAAEYIQQTLKEKLGINVKIAMYEWNEFFNKFMAKDYEFCILSWGAYYNDPSNFFEVPWPPSGILDAGWRNAEYDKCVEKAQTELDPAARYELFKRADEILCKDDAAFMPVMSWISYVYNKEFIKGVSVSPFNTMGWQIINTQERP